jgi:hypothetical protein
VEAETRAIVFPNYKVRASDVARRNAVNIAKLPGLLQH